MCAHKNYIIIVKLYFSHYYIILNIFNIMFKNNMIGDEVVDKMDWWKINKTSLQTVHIYFYKFAL